MVQSFPDQLDGIFDSRSFKKVYGNNLLKSKFLTGPAQTRRRNSRRIDTYSGNFSLTSDQLDVFELWYSSTLRDGSLSFYLNDPITREIKIYKFAAEPNVVHVGGSNWSVSLSIEDA